MLVLSAGSVIILSAAAHYGYSPQRRDIRQLYGPSSHNWLTRSTLGPPRESKPRFGFGQTNYFIVAAYTAQAPVRLCVPTDPVFPQQFGVGSQSMEHNGQRMAGQRSTPVGSHTVVSLDGWTASCSETISILND